VQAERGDLGGVGMAVDAEDTALLTQPIAVEIEVEAGVAGVHLARLLRVQRCIPTVFTGARAKRRSRPVRLRPGSSSCCCSSVPRDLKPLRYLSMSSGSIDISHCPVPLITTSDFAFLIHAG